MNEKRQNWKNDPYRQIKEKILEVFINDLQVELSFKITFGNILDGIDGMFENLTKISNQKKFCEKCKNEIVACVCMEMDKMKSIERLKE